jgi:hypothetical protein
MNPLLSHIRQFPCLRLFCQKRRRSFQSCRWHCRTRRCPPMKRSLRVRQLFRRLEPWPDRTGHCLRPRRIRRGHQQFCRWSPWPDPGPRFPNWIRIGHSRRRCCHSSSRHTQTRRSRFHIRWRHKRRSPGWTRPTLPRKHSRKSKGIRCHPLADRRCQRRKCRRYWSRLDLCPTTRRRPTSRRSAHDRCVQ